MKANIMDDAGHERIGRARIGESRMGRSILPLSILPLSLLAAVALLTLQGCSGGGTTNKTLLMNMGVSDTSYVSRQAGGRG
jgi:hypothetical protein